MIDITHKCPRQRRTRFHPSHHSNCQILSALPYWFNSPLVRSQVCTTQTGMISQISASFQCQTCFALSSSLTANLLGHQAGTTPQYCTLVSDVFAGCRPCLRAFGQCLKGQCFGHSLQRMCMRNMNKVNQTFLLCHVMTMIALVRQIAAASVLTTVCY